MRKFANVLLLTAILLFATFCGSRSEKEFFDSAKSNIIKENYSEAVTELQDLVDEYPDGEYAPKAFLEMGKIYHSKLIKSMNEQQSLNKAVEYYTRVYSNFPKSDDAPNALFMVGFIQANELNEIESAKNIYTKFLEKYPENELAPSAKAELENLGKSPEEIIKEKANS